MTRKSGILLHPTSLPGPGPIGELGPAAYAFIDFLHSAGQRLWQMLPLVPTGWGDSPYQSTSAFATNALLVSPELLIEEDLVSAAWVKTHRPPSRGPRVDYEATQAFKVSLFAEVAAHFDARASDALKTDFRAFCESQSDWLDDYALFTALYKRYDGACWNTWPVPLAEREASALARAREELTEDIERLRIEQFLFAQQWETLHEYARERDVELIGDIPIFVDLNSADVWAAPELFRLDDAGQPTVVAGVPPDYFSKTGQLWGNPLYRWEAHAETGYAWWIRRMQNILALVDRVRIDHFRGFESYWEVPAGAETAMGGTWVPGPGRAVFDAIHDALGDCPIIAEDLGLITPEVTALREDLGFPGMRVLHFGFSGEPENVHLPHNYERNTVAYPGTHDNDTSRGWYEKAPAKVAHNVRVYLSVSGEDIAWDLIGAAWSSVARWSLCCAQDLLNLGSGGRMNTPGVSAGNWSWRLLPGQLTPEIAERLYTLTERYNRRPLPEIPEEDDA